MIRIGIIGYGNMGRIRRQSLKHVAGVEIKRISETTEIDPRDPDAHLVVADPRSILDDPDIDAVVVCTPNFLNKKLTIAALEAGKHVFCEKPPAFSARDVEEIIAVEDRVNKVLMYGFNHRHHCAAVKMRETVESGEFGRVLWMRGRYGKSVDENYFDTWRAKAELAGGGILIDQGIHMLDLFLYIGGGFDEVHAFVSSLYWKLPNIEDNVFAIFRNSETGLCASLHSTMTQWRHLFSFEVFMERGYMVLNGLKTPSGTYGAEKLAIAKNRTTAPAATWQQEEVYQFDADLSWEREMRLFCESCEDGTTKTSDSKSALELMRIVDRIYSHDRHQADALYERLNAEASG
jgi:predicted dehydrogenase